MNKNEENNIIDFLITLVILYENRDDINNREFEKCAAAKEYLFKLVK